MIQPLACLSRRGLLRVVSALLLSTVASASIADETAPSCYLIGNSLTWDTVPSKLDGDVQWHVDCGKSLPYMYEHPEMPCVAASTLWPTALKEKQYDFVSVQTHYGATLAEDVETISKWMAMQPKATFVIHTGWARSATRAEEYSSKTSEGKMQHSPAYVKALIAALKKQHPDRIFRQTHAIDLLATIAADIAAKQAPFQDITDIYRDAIHMNTKTGRYLMHNAMRYAISQPRSNRGFEQLEPALKNYFDSVLDKLPDLR